MVDSYGDRVLNLMGMVSSGHERWAEAEWRKHGLNTAKWGALSQLALADPDALSGADLLDRGLIDRSPNPQHGRILDLRITPPGRKLVESLQVRMRALRESLQLMMVDLDLYLPPADRPR